MFVEPLAIALHAIRRTPVLPGDVLLVLGAGSLGRAVVVAARHAGCRVLVAERTPARRRVLAPLGAELLSRTLRSSSR